MRLATARLSFRGPAVAALAMVATFWASTALGALTVTGGLELWLDAQDVDGLNDGQTGGDLSTWVNKGTGNNATQGTTSLQPTLILGTGPNGTDLVEFDGGDKMAISSLSIGENETIFAVFSTDVAASGQGDQIFNSGVAPNVNVEVQDSQARGRIYTGSANYTVAGPVTTNTDYLYTYVLQETVANGTELFLNGVSQQAITMPDLAPASSGTAYLGSHPSSSRFFDGNLMELLIYDRALTPAEQNSVGSYLEEKYGLTTAYGPPTAIGATFNGATADQYTILQPGDIAGVVPTTNWNNLDTTGGGLGFSFGPQALVDDTGAATTVTVSSSLSSGYNANGGIGNSTPDHTLMNGILNYTTSSDGGSIDVSGLNGFAQLYDLYVYIEAGTNNNRDIEAMVAGLTIRGQDRGGFDGVFTLADGTLDGTTDHDYILFSGLTGDSFSIGLDNPLNNGRAGIAGFQIVAVPAAPEVIPEPSVLLIWSLLAGLGIGAGWRRRTKWPTGLMARFSRAVGRMKAVAGQVLAEKPR